MPAEPDHETEEPSPRPYPTLLPPPEPTERRLAQVAAELVPPGNNEPSTYRSGSAARSTSRRPRNLRKQGTSRSSSRMEVNPADQRPSMISNDLASDGQDFALSNHVTEYQEQVLRKKFSAATSSCPEPVELSDVPQPLSLNEILDEPAILDQGERIQPVPQSQADPSAHFLVEQSPRIIDDIGLKGITMPELMDEQRREKQDRKTLQPARAENAQKRIQSKRSEQVEEPSSISNLLNQRINLSKSTIKNQWLDDLKIGKSAEAKEELQDVDTSPAA